MFKFTSLISLDLSFNQIEKVIDPFPTQLETLKLNRNKLRSIQGLLLCQSLTELNISHNQIKTIDGLPKTLKKLDISYNYIDGDINLRMLGLCPNIISINIDQNPVVYHLKNWRARLFSLLPKLEEINNEVLPKVRKQQISTKVVLSRDFYYQQNQYNQQNQQNNGNNIYSRYSNQDVNKSITKINRSPVRNRSISPNKSNISPTRGKKMKKSDQVASDEQRYKEYEQLRKSREKLEKEMNETLLSLSRSVHKKPLPAKHLEDLSLRLNKWKPDYLKKLEKQVISLNF